MCKAENLTPRKGDVLFVRTGMIPEWEAFTGQQKRAYGEQKNPEHAGVEASIELLEWLWDSGITAVAGDAISWEVRRSSTLSTTHLSFVDGILIDDPQTGLSHTERSFGPRVSARWVGYANR
jgi:kynurenine formamidase